MAVKAVWVQVPLRVQKPLLIIRFSGVLFFIGGKVGANDPISSNYKIATIEAESSS